MIDELSILIPVYNCTCASLVETLHNQCAAIPSLQWEIIVADDGSTDNSIIEANLAINKLAGCLYILREKNTGRAMIRNFLATKSHYGKLLFLDADVAIQREDFIQKYISESDTGDIVCGRYDIISPTRNLSHNLRYIYEKDYIRKHPLSVREKHPYQSFSTANFLINRDIMLAHPFDESIREYGYEDVLFGKLLEKENISIKHIDNPVTLYDFESNIKFIEKTETALNTLYHNREKMKGFSRLAHFAEQPVANRIITSVYNRKKGQWRKSLCDTSPSLKIFQLYKAGYYITLIQKSH